MSARLLVVHDDPSFRDEVAARIAQARFDVHAFGDPLSALVAIDTCTPDLLLTRADFGPGRLNGVALARMARLRSRRVKILFALAPEYIEHAQDLGQCVVYPCDAAVIANLAIHLVTEEDSR